MKSFLNWYFVRAPLAQLRFINNLLIILEDIFGLELNFRYFFTPIFGDKSIIGHFLTLIFRTTIIFIGAILLIISSLILYFIPILFFTALPISIKFPLFLIIPLLTIFYYLFYASEKSERILPKKHATKDLICFADQNTRKYFNQKNGSILFQEITKSTSVVHFSQRLILNLELLIEEIKDCILTTDNLFLQLNQIIKDHNIRQIRPIHIFYAQILSNKEIFDIPLKKQELDLELLNKYLNWEEFEHQKANPPKIWEEDYLTFTGGGTNRTWQGTVTPVLNQYSTDLTSQACQNNDRVIRTNLILSIQSTIQKQENSSIMLIGEIGVGKDTLIQEIAQAIATGHIKGPLWSKRIVQLDTSKLYAGILEGSESFESRVQNIISELRRSKNIILYLNDFSSSLQTTGNGKISLFSLLQQSIGAGIVKIIGSLTPREYHLLENTAPAFLNEFTTIKISETDAGETTHILHNQTLKYEYKDKLFFPYPTIQQIYNYSLEYFQEDAMPQRAIKLLQDTVSSVRTKSYSENQLWHTIYGKRIPITNQQISQTIQEILRIPVGDVEKSEAAMLLNLESIFQNYIIDQTEATVAIAKTLRRNRAGLRNKNKPIGTFLFVGPTGVGKTEMAKTLSRIYYQTDNRMLRFDMSEFKEIQSIERLIGSTVGTSVQTLTEQIKKQPFSLILLDEIEKAHPQILDLFLQVLDDGILTDGLGQTIRFNESIIIATSNAKTAEISELFKTVTSSDQYKQIKDKIPQILSQDFRIEFLNRFDDIILFKPLTPQSVEKIVKMLLKKISQDIYEQRKIQVIFSDETIKSIVKNGYNKDLGARPLQREIQDTVESKLAILLLQNTLKPGQSITL